MDHLEARAGESESVLLRSAVNNAYTAIVVSSFGWLQQLSDPNEKFKFITCFGSYFLLLIVTVCRKLSPFLCGNQKPQCYIFGTVCKPSRRTLQNQLEGFSGTYDQQKIQEVDGTLNNFIIR